MDDFFWAVRLRQERGRRRREIAAMEARLRAEMGLPPTPPQQVQSTGVGAMGVHVVGFGIGLLLRWLRRFVVLVVVLLVLALLVYFVVYGVQHGYITPARHT